MEKAQELQLSMTSNGVSSLPIDSSIANRPLLPKPRHYKWWLLVSLYTVLVLVGQTGATLLGRLYFNNGGTSKWMATIVQSAGFPILFPFLIYFTRQAPSNESKNTPSYIKLGVIYLLFGSFVCGNNLMYSYGTSYLPVSTFSLIAATQLGFNALFSYFLNSLKFTPYILNSIVLLTTSAVVLGVQGEPSPVHSNIPAGKRIAGFLCTIGASAMFSLTLSLTQLFFEKIRKKENFSMILEMAFFTTMVATSGSVIGLFASGDWKDLRGEMESFTSGNVSYVMTLVWTALLWTIYYISSLGLIHEASSLFCNVISTVWLPVIPILAVVLFHDKMDGIKVVSMVLAMWGFVSYVYEHYLDYLKAKATITSTDNISAC